MSENKDVKDIRQLILFATIIILLNIGYNSILILNVQDEIKELIKESQCEVMNNE